MIEDQKSRIFHIAQYVEHPKTKEKLFSEEQIKEALEHKMIGRYVYILHDKDTYTEKDEIKNPLHKKGTLKPKHYHVIIELTTRALAVSVISRWFDVKQNFIKIIKGRNGFVENVKYILHENDEKKCLYLDSEVKSNFNFRESIDRYDFINENKKITKASKRHIRELVLYDGMSINQVIERYPHYYSDDMNMLNRMRQEYVLRNIPLPKVRINYYVYGNSGFGKGLISKSLSRMLIRNFHSDLIKEEEKYFVINSKGISFDSYDGQPIILWDDYRSDTLINNLGSIENIYNIFDIFPKDISQNVKYGRMRLCNEVNIICGPQNDKDFLDELVISKYEDNKQIYENKDQSYRRFLFIIRVEKDSIFFKYNLGIFNKTKDYQKYSLEYEIPGNIEKIYNKCKFDDELLIQFENELFQPIIDLHKEYMESYNEEVNKEEALEYLEELKQRKIQIEKNRI